ncbi:MULTISPECIES: hypothetical protein [Rhizobium]|uniref:Uncharacterized protein n=1 Tax=Rhizobium tropici TaxID=398 RepID=A0A6P1CBQ9_RHITR|nr:MULTISPECIES: hypothetical protein [Rhizobium]AGB71781.1 hypothetical protein RTCIAT899_CH12000 [Rhizobium tropici CIAT 899]MBB4245089.1 hypothetical protein [Rhizobium tropici]MBB5596452.1 hypothetical protein [Rhizobium tropici]MBB6495457.1 hypothetical protein [Rhizobium tropici]NEV14498.1 hypothetical protein [Rhizobium tropici]
MIRNSLGSHGHFLNSSELDLCQRAFEGFLAERNIAKDSEMAEEAAAMIIELYQQGIHDEQQLVLLAKAAHGAL